MFFEVIDIGSGGLFSLIFILAVPSDTKELLILFKEWRRLTFDHNTITCTQTLFHKYRIVLRKTNFFHVQLSQLFLRINNL